MEPFAAPCLATVHIGGMRPVKTANAARAVEITAVTAAHDSTVPRSLLTDPERKRIVLFGGTKTFPDYFQALAAVTGS